VSLRERKYALRNTAGAWVALAPRRLPDSMHLETNMYTSDPLPQLRFDIAEVARILRISRATLYGRIREGRISTQKDGRRTFITASELHRYVNPPR
jgi:excisionase family DNA binding protein